MKNQIEKKRATQMFMGVTAMGLVLVACLLGLHAGFGKSTFDLESTIVFSSTRDDPTSNPFLAAEIYLMNPDGTNLRRLTNNAAGDGIASLSPDGKKIIFDSNRNRAEGEPINTSDLFVMNTDGTEQIFVVRGSSATWSPNSTNIAFHASASGAGLPTRPDAGPPTIDSDIFVGNLDDLLNHTAAPINITNSPEAIDDDADWSPDGKQIVFTRHPVTDNLLQSNLANIFVLNLETGLLTQLTFDANPPEEERGPSWSKDGTRIVYACRKGSNGTFEICVMNADGTYQTRLTNNLVGDLTPTFSPDGQKIVFHRGLAPQQMLIMNADGTGQMQLTFPPGFNNLANWGVLRVHLQQ